MIFFSNHPCLWDESDLTHLHVIPRVYSTCLRTQSHLKKLVQRFPFGPQWQFARAFRGKLGSPKASNPFFRGYPKWCQISAPNLHCCCALFTNIYQYCKCVHLLFTWKSPLGVGTGCLDKVKAWCPAWGCYSFISYVTIREHQYVHPSAGQGPVSIQTGRTSGPRGHSCLPLYTLLRRMPSEQNRIFIPPESARRSAKIGACLLVSIPCLQNPWRSSLACAHMFPM